MRDISIRADSVCLKLYTLRIPSTVLLFTLEHDYSARHLSNLDISIKPKGETE